MKEEEFQLGQVVERLRKSKKLSQEKLANDVLSHRNTINNIEKHSVIPSADLLFRIAERLGVSVEYLFRYTKSEQYEVFFRVKQKIEYENVRNFNFWSFREYLDMITDNLFNKLLVVDKQWVMYYQAICSDYIDDDQAKAERELKEALYLTYNDKAESFSNQEVLIINMLMKYDNRQSAVELAEKAYEFYKRGNSYNIKRETFLKLCNGLIIINTAKEDWEQVYKIASHNEDIALISDSFKFLINFGFAHGLSLYMLGDKETGIEKIKDAYNFAKCYPNKLFYLEMQKDLQKYNIEIN